MKLSIHSAGGGGSLEVADKAFGAAFNEPLVHQVVTAFLAKGRRGTKAQKNRSSARGGGAKPWRQKGTGRARQGSTRSPLQRHGGVVFGPHPRSYRQRMPKRMRRKAILGALSGKAAAERIFVVDGLEGIEPKTKTMVELLGVLGI